MVYFIQNGKCFISGANDEWPQLTQWDTDNDRRQWLAIVEKSMPKIKTRTPCSLHLRHTEFLVPKIEFRPFSLIRVISHSDCIILMRSNANANQKEISFHFATMTKWSKTANVGTNTRINCGCLRFVTEGRCTPSSYMLQVASITFLFIYIETSKDLFYLGYRLRLSLFTVVSWCTAAGPRAVWEMMRSANEKTKKERKNMRNGYRECRDPLTNLLRRCSYAKCTYTATD